MPAPNACTTDHRPVLARWPGVAALRRLAATPAGRPPEACAFCNVAVGDAHAHVIELDGRRVSCACRACALLFSGSANARYRTIPDRVEDWSDLPIADADLRALHAPINLAFVYTSAARQRVVAAYPSPAGPVESAPPAGAWSELVARHPRLAQLALDVEALLVNRLHGRRDCLRVPIDECYRLCGAIRTQWRGLSGGDALWRAVEATFDALHARAVRPSRAAAVHPPMEAPRA